jgi:hypothetical protein
MSDGFTFGAAMHAPSIFECPHCKETIDSSAVSCRFCGTPVDAEEAQKAAVLMARINQACSDASYMKSTAVSIPVFFVLRFIPFASMLGGVGFIGLSFVVPIWAVRWWLKFGSIVSDDADFRKARSTVKIAGILVSVVLVLLVILPFLFGLIHGLNP